MGAARFALPAALAGVAAGIVVAYAHGSLPPVPLLAAGLLLALPAVASRGRWATLAIVGVAVAGLGVGAWRGEEAQPPAGDRSVVSLVDGEEHRVTGTVLDDPRPRADRLQLVLGEVHVAGDGAARALDDRLLVWLPRGIDARSGDRVIIDSEIELPEDFDGFAYREYLSRQGVGAIARARTATVVPGEAGLPAVLAAARGLLLGGLNDLVPEPQAALGAGILLGVRASIAPEINDAFAAAGLTHVVAISGWNIAIVAALVAALVGPLSSRRGGRATGAIVGAATVGGYVMLTGASPSVVRAALMAGAMLVGRLGGSRAHAASALGLAALIMLLAAPPVLWDVGFQLSLLATAGLIWYGASVERRLPGWPAPIREPVALTLAAQLTTLPVVLVNFERLSLVAPIANVLVVPFVPIAMLFSAIASIVGALDGAIHLPIVGSIATWLAGGAAWLTLWIIVTLGLAAASVPFAAVDVAVPPALAVAWFPVLALGTWALRSERSAAADDRAAAERTAGAQMLARFVRPLPVLGALVAVLLGITIASRPDGLLHVTVLDIGQGDAILVEAPSGATMLVDGGPDPELTLRRLGANLPFFARRIDLLLLSHPHQDHVAGLVEVLERFRVRAVIHGGIGYDNPAYDQLLADAAGSGVEVGLARTGQVVRLDAATSVRVLYPTEADADAPLPEGDINNGSVVVALSFGGFDALLTGDAEAPVEATLVSRGLLEPVELLKVGHHGSTSSTTAGLLGATRPSVAVISAGVDNEYGHPAPETLAILASRPSISVYRTDTDGDVEVETDGRTYRVRTDAGWSAPRAVHEVSGAGSIGPWPCPTDRPVCACSTRRGCPTAFASTRSAWHASPWPPPASWPRRRSRSMAPSSRRRPSCTTSTRSRSDGAAGSTASSARGSSKRSATTSSRSRSPPIRSTRSSTTTVSRSVGPRSSWLSRTATWPSRS